MNFKSPNSIATAVLGLALVLSALPAAAHFPIPPKKGEIGRKEVHQAAPAFSLLDQSGQIFKFNAAGGNLVLVNFIYTSCLDVCPLFTAKMAAIQRALEAENNDQYMLLSISTDPKRDTPVKLKAYADAFKADYRRWHFLTGSVKELTPVWRAFGVNVKELGDGQVQHTNLTTLIDGKGFRRVDYYGDKWLEKEILKDLRQLAAQK